MSKIDFELTDGTLSTFELLKGESLLDGLLSNGHKIPNSCRAGLCHACLMQASRDSVIPIDAQQGLSTLQCQQQMLLACQCYPQKSLSVALPNHTDDWLATVVGHRKYNDHVLELRLKVDGSWRAGQHLLLWRDEDQARPYSIASRCDANKEIVLHIERHRKGRISRWCHEAIAVGDTVRLSAPEGHCCYSCGDTRAALILVATGTGLAPLYGVLLDALAHGHEGDIALFVAAPDEASFYLVDELLGLAASHNNLSVYFVLRTVTQVTPIHWPLLKGNLESLVIQRYPNLRGAKVFLCGNPQMVEGLTKRCFLAGARRGDILSDAFVLGA